MEDEARRKQRFCKLVKESLKNLNEAEEILRTLGLNEAADQLHSNTYKLQVRVSEVLPLVGAPKVIQIDRHRFEAFFYTTWKEIFPNYGDPSSRDKAGVNEMFDLFDSAFPTATEAFIRRMVQNYRGSNVEWVDSKEIHIFARNIRKFVKGPLIDESRRLQEAPAARASNTLSRVSFSDEAPR